MSRSNPKENLSPIKRRYSLNAHGKKGGFLSYYDKKTEEKLEVKLPFQFIQLDTLVGISGYNRAEKSGIWSNHIHNSAQQELVVKLGGKTHSKGLYQEIKANLPSGAKFCNFVYLGYKNEAGELEIGLLEIKGASLSSWFDLKKSVNIDKEAVVVKELILHDDGDEDNSYYSMVFDSKEISEETNKAAVDLDIELQKYLTSSKEDAPEESVNDKFKDVTEDDGDDLPF